MRSPRDCSAAGCREAATAGLTWLGLLDVVHASYGVLDCAITGASAKIALQGMRKVLTLRLIERRRGHYHAGGAEAALERLGIEECLLRRVHTAVAHQSFNGRYVAMLGANGRNMQLCTGSSSSMTVQAPQSPASHPFLTPNQPSSRRKVRKHCPGRASFAYERPFTR